MFASTVLRIKFSKLSMCLSRVLSKMCPVNPDSRNALLSGMCNTEGTVVGSQLYHDEFLGIANHGP